MLTTLAISIERCLAILYPFKLKVWLTNKRILFVILFIWISSTIFSIPLIKASTFFSAYHREFNRNVSVCYLSINSSFFISYLFTSLGLFYLLPCFVLFVLYLKLVIAISKRNQINNSECEEIELTSNQHRNQSNYTASSTNISNSKMPKINTNQIIVLLIIMMLLVIICLLPIRVFTIWFALADKKQRKALGIYNYSIILTFCRVMFYLNSVLNPVFYHFMSSKFQMAFRNLFFGHTNKSKSTSRVVLCSNLNQHK